MYLFRSPCPRRCGARLAALFLGGLFAACPARAYVLEGPRWPDNTNVVLYLQLGSPGVTLIDGSTSWNAVALTALSIWNPNLGGSVQFTTGTTAIPNASGDGKNSVFFSGTVFGQAFGDDALAITQYYYTTSGSTGAETFTEADVVFNSAVTFDSYRGNLRDGTPDFRRVALHEFGHALGLGHVPQTADAIMTPVTTNIDTIQADDIAGVQSLYGVPHPAFFSGEAALGNGVYYLKFPDGTPFGYYSYLSDAHYLYHFDLGYAYWFDAADGQSGVYLYDFASQTFFYTSPVFPFPYLYDFTLNTVLYYYPNTSSAGHYTTAPRYFYNFATHKIITK